MAKRRRRDFRRQQSPPTGAEYIPPLGEGKLAIAGMVRAGYQRGFIFLAALAFWGINWELALNFLQKGRWFTRSLWVSLFGGALLFVGSRIHRLTEELREKLSPQDFHRGVEQMQRSTLAVLQAATPIIALAVLAGRRLQPLGTLASLLLYLGYLAWERRRK